MKKIVICSSVSFEKEIIEWKEKLEKLNFEVAKYPIKLSGNFIDEYEKEFSNHYKAIFDADAIIVLNIEKNGIPGYIGPGVFAEISFATGLNKVSQKEIIVYCINSLPQNLPYSEELNLWQKLNWIKIFKI